MKSTRKIEIEVDDAIKLEFCINRAIEAMHIHINKCRNILNPIRMREYAENVQDLKDLKERLRAAMRGEVE